MHCLYCGEKITTTTYQSHGTVYIHEKTWSRFCDTPRPVASPRLDFS